MTDVGDLDIEFVIVAAVAENGVIGNDNSLPWHIPEDLKRFKRTTIGHPVVMGRKTYEGIVARLGEALPGRTSIVLTRSTLDAPEGVIVVNGIEEALEVAAAVADERGRDRAFVIGGGEVYAQFLPFASRMLLTEVEMEPDGDVTFPAFDENDWRETERDVRDGYAFVEYIRRSETE